MSEKIKEAKNKSKRGGAREGAGRPRKSPKVEIINESFTIENLKTSFDLALDPIKTKFEKQDLQNQRVMLAMEQLAKENQDLKEMMREEIKKNQEYRSKNFFARLFNIQ